MVVYESFPGGRVPRSRTHSTRRDFDKLHYGTMYLSVTSHFYSAGHEYTVMLLLVHVEILHVRIQNVTTGLTV